MQFKLQKSLYEPESLKKNPASSSFKTPSGAQL